MPREKPGNYTLRFGKHKGSRIREIARNKEGRSYLEWIVREFDEDDPTRAAAHAYLTSVAARDNRKEARREIARLTPKPDRTARRRRPKDDRPPLPKITRTASQYSEAAPADGCPFEPGIFVMGERRTDLTYTDIMSCHWS